MHVRTVIDSGLRRKWIAIVRRNRNTGRVDSLRLVLRSEAAATDPELRDLVSRLEGAR